MKIQILNLFFLSIVLLLISGCQELEQINLYNQNNLLTKNQENQLATEEIIVKPKLQIINNVATKAVALVIKLPADLENIKFS